MQIVDNQATVHLSYKQGEYHFSLLGQKYRFPTLEKVHEFFFTETKLDTVKLCHQGKKSYVHFSIDEIETFTSKKALRRILSQESNGAWIEKRGGEKKYFVDNGWLFSSIKKVSKEDYQNRPEKGSTFQKVLGIALGLFAIAPAAVEIARKVPVGTNEVGMGLLALQQRSPLLAFVGCSLWTSSVNGQAMGTEFLINTNTSNDQERAAITTLVNGSFVVTWQGKQDNIAIDIYAQMFNETGAPIGPEFLVNTDRANSQNVPSITWLKDGGFVIAWNGNQNVDYDAYAQRYYFNANPWGSEFRINPIVTNSQGRPALAGLDDGGFIAVWDDDRGTNNDLEVYAQIYSPNGATAGSDFRVNTNTLNRQWYPDVTLLADGTLVVVWISGHAGINDDNIYGQILSSVGVSIGSEILINTNTTGSQLYPKAAGLKNGNFIVTWQSLQSGIDMDIYAKIYNATGFTIKPDFRVNTNTTNNQDYPRVTGLAHGGFAVVWEGRQGAVQNIYAQVFDENGDPVGSELRVNSTPDYCYQPDIAPLENGGFVIVWENFQNGNYDIYAQMYDANAALVSSMVFPSTFTTPTPSASSSYITQTATTPSSPSPTNSFSSTGPQQTPSSITFSASSVPPSQSLSSIIPLISSILTTPIPTPSIVQTSGPQALSSDESGCGQGCIGGIAGGVIGAITIAATIFGFYRWKKSNTKEPEDIEFQSFESLDPKILKLFDGYPKAQKYWDKVSGKEQTLIKALVALMQQANPALSQPQANPDYGQPDSVSSGSEEIIPQNPPTQANPAAQSQANPNYAPLDISVSSSSEETSSINPNNILNRQIIQGDQHDYEIIPVITQREANQLRRQTGYRVDFGGQAQVQKVKLGSGHFGEVSIAQIRGEQRFVAVKEVQGKENIKQSRKEGRYHAKLTGGPNILPIYDSIRSGDKLYHFIQLAGFGDGRQLKDKLVNIGPQLQESILMKTALSLCSGLLYMHGKNIYHFDLKPDNILFDQVGEVYLSDFGRARKVENRQITHAYGHLDYASPEARKLHYNELNRRPIKPIDAEKQDAWGLGMILVEMLGLFDGNRDGQFETTIRKTLIRGKHKKGTIEYLILELLQPNPAHRWTVQNAHDYLTQNCVTIGDEAREAIFDVLARIPADDLD